MADTKAKDERVKTDGAPITTSVGRLRFEAKPLPWRKRNELGRVIAENYTKAILAGRMDVHENPDGTQRIDFSFSESAIDYDAILALMYPENKVGEEGDFEALDFRDLIDKVMDASLVVNGLERQRHMLDLGKSVLGQEPSSADGDDGPKTGSSPD